MFGNNKKTASSFIELLIILAIIGVLSVMYQRTVDKDAIVAKYAYKNILNNVISYAATATDSYQVSLPSNICTNLFDMVNTIGDKYCEASVIPNIPNIITTSGMRFFGLRQDFQDRDGETPFLILDVDTDGMNGDNALGKDIFSLELLQSGKVRPSGAAVLSGNSQVAIKGNPTRDPALYTTMAFYVPENVTERKGYLAMGNRLSYSEAQCLTGNLFPYRERSEPYNIQMCIEDSSIRTAINNYRNNPSAANRAAKENAIKAEMWTQASNNTICNQLYTDNKSVAHGITSASTSIKNRCRQCYKAAYKSKYCGEGSTEPNCSNAALVSEKGHCETQEFAETSN